MSATLRASASRSSDRSLRNGVIGKPNTPVKRVRTSFAVIVALQGNIGSRKGAKTQRKPKRGLLCVFAPLRDNSFYQRGKILFQFGSTWRRISASSSRLREGIFR